MLAMRQSLRKQYSICNKFPLNKGVVCSKSSGATISSHCAMCLSKHSICQWLFRSMVILPGSDMQLKIHEVVF